MENLPPHVIQRIFHSISDIQTRLRLEAVSRSLHHYAVKFCWRYDSVLEVTPHVTSFLELRSVNIKVFSKKHLHDNCKVGDYSTSCKVEAFPDALRCILAHMGDNLEDLRLWGSTYSYSQTFSRNPWLERTFEELTQDNLPTLTRILVTNEFAQSLLVPKIVDRHMHFLIGVHFSIASEFCDENFRPVDTVLNICETLAKCSYLEELTLELCDTPILSDEVLGALLRQKRNLKCLRLRKISSITGLGLSEALKACFADDLVELEVSQCKDFFLNGFLRNNIPEVIAPRLSIFRYWPSENDANFGSVLPRIPDIFPLISRLDITEWSFSFHNPEGLAALVARFLQKNYSNLKPQQLDIEAHCVLLMTTNQLTTAVLDRVSCDAVTQAYRVDNKFSNREYFVQFFHGTCNVCFSFSV